jgi:hypothetical protein
VLYTNGSRAKNCREGSLHNPTIVTGYHSRLYNENSKHKITNSNTNALELLFKAKYEKIFSDWGDQICVFMKIKYPFEKYYMGL